MGGEVPGGLLIGTGRAGPGCLALPRSPSVRSLQEFSGLPPRARATRGALPPRLVRAPESAIPAKPPLSRPYSLRTLPRIVQPAQGRKVAASEHVRSGSLSRLRDLRSAARPGLPLKRQASAGRARRGAGSGSGASGSSWSSRRLLRQWAGEALGVGPAPPSPPSCPASFQDLLIGGQRS